jgi:invasion protein IalB
MMIQLPVGLFLPGGVNFQIDDGKLQALAIQACDLKGCYAATTVSRTARINEVGKAPFHYFSESE